MRIIVTGNAGSGKSTLARRVSAEMGIPFYSLDRVIWQTGWKKTPEDEKLGLLYELIAQEEWVIDGVSAVVQSAADVVIFLDVPRRICFLRAMKRSVRYLFRSRPEMPPGCPEILILPTLLRIIWNFPMRARVRILQQATAENGSRQFQHVIWSAGGADADPPAFPSA